jgi:DNA-binding CsgD family transcriptional regulator/KaiC/GvpD/RAD55 family RecA-like ATPase
VQAIVGRTEEVEMLASFVADERPEPRALLIDGEPGIGKTTLLQHLQACAAERGWMTLAHRPTRSEMDLSYAGLVELLDRIGDEVVDALPAPQARVLRMVLRKEEPDELFDRLSLSIAVVAVLRAVGVHRPVLLTVDDVQWLDPPTARTLVFVLRRLGGTSTRVALVRSVGWSAPGAPGAGVDALDWLDELTRAMPAGRLDRIRLGPIGPSGLSRILRRMLGWVPAWPRVVRIAELSAGNPLYAIELTRAFGNRQSGDDLDSTVPDSAVELARSRIAQLPQPVREAVELASVLRAPTLELLRRLDSTAIDLRESLASAARVGIVAMDGERVRFVHPVIATATYGSIPVTRRRELHRAVAMLSDDLEERARHLAIAAEGPDPHVALALHGAAEQAWRRGAPDAAADLLRLACQLTPTAEAEALALRRIAYGRLLHSAGDAPAAIAELESLAKTLPPGLIRARALYHLMYVLRLSGVLGRAVDHGVQAAAEAAGDPLFQAEVYQLLSRLSDNDIARKLDTARKGLEAIAQIPYPDPDVVFYVQAAVVEAEFYAGLGIHLDRLEGIDPGTRPPFPPTRSASRGDDLIGRLLTFAGHVDEGLDTLRGMCERVAVASRSTLPAVLGWMAEGQLIAGRFAAAAALTQEAIERAEEIGHEGGYPWEVGFHAVALAMLGRLDEAEIAATRIAHAAEADPSIGLDEGPALLASGLIAMARDEFDLAVVALRRLDAMKRSAGIREPRLCAHASDLIEALIGSGQLAEAGEVLDQFEQEAATSSGRWSQAAAARCRALLLAATGRLDDALIAGEESYARLDGFPMPFERARTLFVLGQIRRRRKEKRLAREALTAALATFTELGTPVWADRARAELARIPQRQGEVGLTPTEERIARLAGSGLTNRDIADRMFLSPKTVEASLTRIYRKVGVRSRAALASRFAADRQRGDQP